MRVFVAGATGVLGRRIVAECSARGHEVIGLTRDESGDNRVRDRGGKPVRGDILHRNSLLEAIDGADVVVHAATKIPTDTNPSEAAWELNDRVRREGAENLVAAAVEHGVDRLILQSIVWVARQPDGERFDEDATPHPDRSTLSALEAERIVTGAATEHGFEPVVLRGGWFYAADTAHTRSLGERLLAGKLPIIGRGLLGRREAELSFVHVDDVGRAFTDAIEGSDTGTFHVVDDKPTTYAGFLRTFADQLDAPAPSRVPAWLARWLVDDNIVRLVTRPMPTDNERVHDAFGWRPEYPTIQEGLEQVIEQWAADGTIRAGPDGYEWIGT